jgi:hypothetical protein
MTESILNSVYFEKQRKFVALIKEIQNSLNSKEYKNQGYTFNEYIKIKWNISQAQAYRYLLCGRVLDQLEEFEIKPSYERLCKALATVAKTPIQMKILWSAILKKTGGRPDCVNSTHVNNIWKEICSNKNYSDICKYEGDIMNKIEKSLSKFENEKKHKRLNSNKEINKLNNNNNNININNININISSGSGPYDNANNHNDNSDPMEKKTNNNDINHVINDSKKENNENNNMRYKFPSNINALPYPKDYSNASNTLSLSNHSFHDTSVVSKTVFQTSPLSNNSICSSSSSSSSSISSISFQNMPSSLSNSSIQNLSSIPHDSIYNSNSSLSNHSNITISSLPNIITNNSLSNTSVVFNSFSNISPPISECSSFNSYSVSNNSVSSFPIAPNTLSNSTFISCPVYNTQVMPQILSNPYVPQNNPIPNVPQLSNNSISNIPVISNTASEVSVVSPSTNIPEIKNSIISVPVMNNYVSNGSVLSNTVSSTSNVAVDTHNRQLNNGNGKYKC